MGSQDKLRRLCLDAMLLGMCLLLSYLEAILPLAVWLPLPGFKLGLANIMVALIFVAISPWDGAVVALCRIFLMGLLFGNFVSFTFSLCGGVLSYLGLWLLAKAGRRLFSMVGICVGCAALHNLGQLCMAAVWFGSGIVLVYLPFLLLASLFFGAVTGVLLELILPRFERIRG